MPVVKRRMPSPPERCPHSHPQAGEYAVFHGKRWDKSKTLRQGVFPWLSQWALCDHNGCDHTGPSKWKKEAWRLEPKEMQWRVQRLERCEATSEGHRNGERQENTSPESSEGTSPADNLISAPPDPFRTPDLQIRRAKKSCYFKHSVWGRLL